MNSIMGLVRLKVAPYFFILMTQLPILWKIYTWEPDQHHDGVMFAAAVAVLNGGLPNQDVFAQYGPITPWIQGLWLNLTSPTVLNMRLLTIIFILGISLLVFKLLRRELPINLALLCTFSWTLTGPFGLPWSSLITTFLALLVTWVVSMAVKSVDNKLRQTLLILAALISVIGTFTRIHFILIGFAVGLYLRLTKQKSRFFGLNYYEIASLTFFGLFYLIFESLGILKPYLQQCIFWAFGSYSTAPELSKSLVIDFLWIPVVGLFCLILLYWLGNSFNNVGILKSFIPILVVGLIFSSSLIGSKLTRDGEQTLRNPKILFIDASQKMLYGVGYCSITIFIIISVIFLKQSRFNLRAFPLEFWVAGASLAQLYPFFDPHHVWFVTPMLMVALISVSSHFQGKFKFTLVKGANPVLSALVLVLLSQFLVNASQTRYEYISPQMKGMESVWRSADEIDNTLLKLNQLAIPKSVQFECRDGLYVVANGKYLANSPMFVTWGPKTKSTSNAKQLFACYVDRKQIQSYLNSGYSIVFKTEWQPLTYPNDRKYWNVLFKTP